MFGPEGGPPASYLFEVITGPFQHKGRAMQVSTVPAERDGGNRA